MSNLRAAALAELSPEMAEALVFIVENAKRLGQTSEEVRETYMAAQLSYAEPVPIEPKDELADLIRQYLAGKQETEQAQAKDAARIDSLLGQYIAQRPELRAVA